MKCLHLGVLLSFNVFFLFAEEGLWPLHVDSTFWKSIQVQGIKLDQKDIFQEGGTSLEGAVIRFGNGCSGIVVSENGLVMTNYHCALRYMERITTVKCDYLSNGFWAEREKEVPITGLSVRFLLRTLDVTDLLCKGAWKTMSDKERKQKIQEIERQYMDEAKGYEARIIPVYSGNQYYLYQYQVFKDIRLVGAPPLSLGKFGKDVDNWMWPRHTADFALFRIYAGPDNLPASYSPENVPYQPKKIVPISLEALKEGDFTFVLGYPGSTDQYKHSEVLSNLVQVSYPIQIDLMSKYLDLLSSYMKRDDLFEMHNMAQYGSISNVMKRYQGFIEGMNRCQGIERRKIEENDFVKRLESNPGLSVRYGTLLEEMKQVEQEKVAYAIPYSLYLNGWGMIALLQKALFVSELNKDQMNWKRINRFLREAQKGNDSLFLSMDKEWFVEVMRSYLKNVPKAFHFPSLTKNASCLDKWADSIYEQSVLSDTLKVRSLLENDFDLFKERSSGLFNQ